MTNIAESDLPEPDRSAAEYVLGTLDGAERTAVAARRQREPELDAAIVDWEQRLAPLGALVADVQPPRDLFARIEARIAASGAGSGDIASPVLVDLQRRLARWRTATVLSGALAASLLVLLGVREYDRADSAQKFVAVFQQGDTSPSFVMTVDLAAKTLSVRRVSATVPDGKTYQLWIASDKLTPGPHSLGLVQGQTTEVRTTSVNIDPAIVPGALFAVSLEPAGGSPLPTGPAFHARLIPTKL